MQFDPNLFEKLDGLEASNYALQLAKEPIKEKDVLPYLESRLDSMDDPHLEVAIFLLSKVGSKSSWNIVADYLDHRNFRIRFVATKMIKTMTTVDEQIMEKIVTRLSNQTDDGLVEDLKTLLDRPQNAEAQQIALNYISR